VVEFRIKFFYFRELYKWIIVQRVVWLLPCYVVRRLWFWSFHFLRLYHHFSTLIGPFPFWASYDRGVWRKGNTLCGSCFSLWFWTGMLEVRWGLCKPWPSLAHWSWWCLSEDWQLLSFFKFSSRKQKVSRPVKAPIKSPTHTYSSSSWIAISYSFKINKKNIKNIYI
jgi:hypothetical protein